jgi:hypothetical protein
MATMRYGLAVAMPACKLSALQSEIHQYANLAM